MQCPRVIGIEWTPPADVGRRLLLKQCGVVVPQVEQWRTKYQEEAARADQAEAAAASAQSQLAAVQLELQTARDTAVSIQVLPHPFKEP